MKKYILSTLIMFSVSVFNGNAQQSTISKINRGGKDFVAIGLGHGLDYAGPIGLKMNFQVIPNFGFFLSGSIWATRFSGTFGLKARLLPKPQSTISPYIIGYYGNNDIKTYEYFTGKPIFRQGFSTGVGFDLLNKPNSFGYFSFGANYAIKPELIYFTVGINVNIVKEK